jgi:FkbM family methyltransferase
MELETVSVPGSGRTLTVAGVRGEYVFDQIAALGDFYERDVLDSLRRLPLAPGDVVLDVGANIGNHTLYFGEHLEQRVVAVEAETANATVLERNVAANGFADRVRVVRGAAWSEPGTVTLDQRIPGNSGTFYVSGSGVGEVPAFRLDDLELDANGAAVGLLKVDVEGAELDVLRGAAKILESDHPHVCVELHDSPSFEAVAALLLGHGYQLVDVQGRSDNYIWVHELRTPADWIPSLRHGTVLLDERGLRKELGTRVDRVGRNVKVMAGEVRAVRALLGDELRTVRAERDDLRRRLRRAEVVGQEWRDAYARLAGSQPVRLLLGLLALVRGRRSAATFAAQDTRITRIAKQAERHGVK